MSSASRLWLITCMILAISSCSAFGQQRDERAQRPIRSDSHSVLTALYGGRELAASCGDSLADVGTLSTSAMLCSAVGTFPAP